MYNPLNIRTSSEGSFITFPMEIDLIDRLFYCNEISNYTSHENGINREVARYEIVDRNDDDQRFIIETIKLTENDFDIRYYELLESLDFDPEFMGMVGTSPFIYYNPKFPDIESFEYDKVEQEGEEFVEQQFNLDIDEEEDDSYKEWASEDENGWFYTVDKSTGILREFSNKEKVYAWIYDRKPEPNSPIYLLIEVKALDSYDEYETQRPKIKMYEGRKLLISDIETT